jgi:hypothetical protein
VEPGDDAHREVEHRQVSVFSLLPAHRIRPVSDVLEGLSRTRAVLGEDREFEGARER